MKIRIPLCDVVADHSDDISCRKLYALVEEIWGEHPTRQPFNCIWPELSPGNDFIELEWTLDWQLKMRATFDG